MKNLLIVFIGVATLGSIYPFDFRAAPLDAETMRAFLHTCCVLTGRGDIVGNIILFSPFGLLGMFAIRPHSSAANRFGLMLVTGVLFATFLQILQIFLPSRDASLQDVIWNLVGMILGGALAVVTSQKVSEATARPINAEIAPTALIASWLAYRLMPFVPSIDLQLFKESVRPLLQPELMPVNILHDATAWLVVGYLLRCMRNDLRLDGVLPALILAVFALEIVIIDNALHASNVVGGLLAIAIWPAMTRMRMRPETVLVALLLLTVTLSGLAPFAASERPASFQWMPFYGFLGGSMYLNALSAAEKVFLYGSMVFLLQRFAVTRTFGVALVFFSVFAIELMQIRLDGHTPEITDPLLVLLAAAALLTLEKERSPSLQHPASRKTIRRGAQRTIRTQNAVPPHARGAWVQQSVNLHGDQLRFVEQLSREMDVSVSRSIRHIVNNVIEDYRLVQFASARDPNAGPWLEILQGRQNRTGRISGRSAWASVTVNLNGSQFETLKGAATTLGISTSRLIRRMVGHFIDELGQQRDVAAAPSPASSAPSDPAPS